MKVKTSTGKMVGFPNEVSGKHAVGNVRSASFMDSLQESAVEQHRRICNELLREIDAESERLKRTPTPEGVRRYQKLVSAFLKEAMNQSYTTNEQTRWDRSGNRKTFLTVKKINQSLAELMDAVVNREKRQIDIVAKLDEIRGLLLDLYF